MFREQPWGDAGEDVRIACSTLAILSALGVKRPRVEQVFPWLRSDVDWDAKERAFAAFAATTRKE